MYEVAIMIAQCEMLECERKIKKEKREKDAEGMSADEKREYFLRLDDIEAKRELAAAINRQASVSHVTQHQPGSAFLGGLLLGTLLD